jgi:single-strand DNA-binding protein
MLNNCSLVGNVTRTPELRFTASGMATTTFSIAINRPTRDAETDYFTIVCFDKLAQRVAEHVIKGQQVAVTARAQNRSWTNEANNKVTVTEFVAQNVAFGRKPNSANTVAATQEVPVEDFADATL